MQKEENSYDETSTTWKQELTGKPVLESKFQIVRDEEWASSSVAKREPFKLRVGSKYFDTSLGAFRALKEITENDLWMTMVFWVGDDWHGARKYNDQTSIHTYPADLRIHFDVDRKPTAAYRTDTTKPEWWHLRFYHVKDSLTEILI